jgi:tRNA(Ile)-lysidine synthase
MSITGDVTVSVRASGMLEPGMRVLAMLSGGADSVCLLHALRELLGPQALAALHVNHGLRAQAVEDEHFCTGLCDRLGIELDVERVSVSGRGNLEARAREARYGAAEQVRERRQLDRIATGHTSSDQVETILYRLVCSPGRRALLGMSQRSGRLIRPLLGLSREQTRDYCRAAGLSWREDATNRDRGLARNRLRLDVLPALREIHPAVEQNVLATADELREEAELLETAIDEAAERLVAPGAAPAVDGARLRELAPPLRRLVLRRLAEQAAHGSLPLRAGQVREIEELVLRGGSTSLDIGGGVRVVSEYGVLRFEHGLEERELEPRTLPVPGRCRFGDWEVVCDLERGSEAALERLGVRDEALLDARKLARSLTVRAWRAGDRMRPLGLDGTKSLQDLFTDRKVPRSLRHALPVVQSDDEIAWVAGVAVSDAFKVTSDTTDVALLRATEQHSDGRS